MHAESVVETRELSPSFDHRWTEHRPAAPASISPTATASQSRLPVQVPMSGAGTLSHYPPAHYNPHLSSYSDRPFASSSPTDSSPSGSPFHPDHHTLARISTTTRPLFLAQHTTPLTPTNLESLSLASPVVAAPPPPPHALVVDKVAAHPPPPPPMAYVSPHHAHYSFPAIYNPPEVGTHRHQLPVGGYTYQVHYPHAYEYPTENYRMNPGQNSGVVDDSSSYETPPLVLGHFTPTSQVPSGGGGVWSPVESPHYGPRAPGQVGHHSHRPPIQTQLLLANAMPITTDIVSPTRGSMEGSVSASTSFAPGMSREYSNPPTPATAHGSGGYTGGTQMGICNGQAAPIAATQPSNAGEGMMIPAQNQASPYEPSGIPVTMSTGASVVGAEPEQQIVKTEQATHEGEADRQQYVQVEQNQTMQQQMDGGLSRSFAPDPDGPEVPRSTNHARELISNDKVDDASRDECQSIQGETTSVGQKNETHETSAQIGASQQHAHEPTNAGGDMESRYADVAVAQITALVARDDSGRFDRIHVSSRDERANVDSRGADNSVRPTEDTLNGQASTLKALATNQSGSHHQTTTDLHDPSSFGDDTRHTLKDAGVVPIAHVHPIHQTGISHHVDIDHSYSIPLQTPVTPHQDMQAISSAPFHHQFHQHHAPHVQGYSYEPAPSFIPSSTFNPHMHPPRPEWRRGSYPEYGTTSGHSQSNRGSPLLLPQDDLRMQRSVSPVPTQNMVHRHSLPTSSLSHNLGSMSTRASPHSSPSLQGAAPTGYYNTSARLVPAAFNGSPRNGSGSSGSSTPPIVSQEPSSSMGLYQQVVPGPQAPAHFHVTTPSTFDSSLDQRPPYEPAFSAFHGPSSAPQQAYGMRASDPVYYSPAQYPGEVVYSSTSGGPRHFDPLARGSSTSPAPPMIAGLKRTREDEWADASEREAQRRRLSYTQSGPAMHHSVHFTYPSSPSLATPEMGVIRVGSSQGHGHGPTLKEMGIRDAVSESLHGGSHMHMKRPDGYSRDGPETSYSFISLPGNTIRKRPRRKFEEITRNYVCSWPDCTKAYGTLNHLNAHVTMQKHGAKRTPAEFKELRKAWRKQKREQQQQQGHSHASGGAAGRRGSSELPGDDDGGDDDDTGSLYGP